MHEYEVRNTVVQFQPENVTSLSQSQVLSVNEAYTGKCEDKWPGKLYLNKSFLQIKLESPVHLVTIHKKSSTCLIREKMVILSRLLSFLIEITSKNI